MELEVGDYVQYYDPSYRTGEKTIEKIVSIRGSQYTTIHIIESGYCVKKGKQDTFAKGQIGEFITKLDKNLFESKIGQILWN